MSFLLKHIGHFVIFKWSPKVFRKKAYIHRNSQEKNYAGVLFKIKFYWLWTWNFLKRDTLTKASSSEFCKISKKLYGALVNGTDTAWKVSKYGVFCGPYFPVFGLNTERYEVSLRIQSERRKIRTRKYSVFGHFLHSEKQL